MNLDDYRIESGQLMSHAWPGGYPLYYLCKDGVLCPDCATDDQWLIVGVGINYEDTALYCDHCQELIESAYGE
ncbi:MAG: hypothetical protein M0R06_18050 [Sphaerochaeta sp.]|jgi:hypothetical protein|nr:hypothetical protein [Sphaerochaeta sp.]